MPDKDHRAAHADEGSELDGGGGGIVEVSGDCRRGDEGVRTVRQEREGSGGEGNVLTNIVPQAAAIH
jgi:hypothetical protein